MGQLPQGGGGMSFCKPTRPSLLFFLSLLFIRGKNNDTKCGSPQAFPGAAYAALVIIAEMFFKHLLF
jgi:hypothetical protein